MQDVACLSRELVFNSACEFIESLKRFIVVPAHKRRRKNRPHIMGNREFIVNVGA